MAVIPHPTKSKKEPGRWWYVDVGRGKERQRIPFNGSYDEAVKLFQELTADRKPQSQLLPKIADMVLPFLEWYQHEALPRTWQDVRSVISVHIVPKLGRYRPDQLAQSVLDGFRNELIAGGATPRTVNKILSYLSAIIKWGVRTGQCKAPPGQMPRFSRKRTQAEPKQALNAAMVDALYAAIEPEYRLLFLLMVDHGLRREEAMHLRFEDIDLQHKVISVLGKGNKRRIVPFMSERFEQELTTAMQRQGRKRGPVAVNPETSRPYYDIRKALLRAAIACGVPPFGHHVLRHTFASRLAENGIPPYVLQRLMGHESQSTTSKIYVHIGGDFVATEARKFRDR